MDRFSSALRLRGPLFDEREELIGSVHVVDVDSVEQGWSFALREPCYQAGAYRDVMIRRWRDVLGRTMWDYPGTADPDGLFCVLGFGSAPCEPCESELPDGDLVAYGELLSDDGARRLGAVAVVRADGAAQAADIFGGRGLVGVEVHRWTFGGRRQYSRAETSD